MDQKGQTAIKFIIAFGIAVFVLLWAVSLMLKQAVRPSSAQLVQIAGSQSPFDPARAWADLGRIVGLGPRPAGSEQAARLREYLRGELQAAGFEAHEQAFPAAAGAPPGMVNLWADCRGDRDGIIVLAAHYDTRPFDGFAFVGANSGGAETAFLLEMARALGPARKGCTVRLVWLDGGGLPGGEDGQFGARAFLGLLKGGDAPVRVAAVLTFDGIGDAYLDIPRDSGAPRWLGSAVWGTALRLGYGGHFLHREASSPGMHGEFRSAGLPVLRVADLSYGGALTSDRRLRHTAEDTLDKVRADSLKAIGDVLYHALDAVDAEWKRLRPPGAR